MAQRDGEPPPPVARRSNPPFQRHLRPTRRRRGGDGTEGGDEEATPTEELTLWTYPKCVIFCLGYDDALVRQRCWADCRRPPALPPKEPIVLRNPLSEIRLTGPNAGRAPTPSCKPALEALEEHIVLSGAPVSLPARAQALAAVNPAVAARKAFGTLTASVEQFTRLQSYGNRRAKRVLPHFWWGGGAIMKCRPSCLLLP
jgi:hypothetical protein